MGIFDREMVNFGGKMAISMVKWLKNVDFDSKMVKFVCKYVGKRPISIRKWLKNVYFDPKMSIS
jgi:hypothetical protein